MSKKTTSFNALGVLELACAAFRYNDGYVKEQAVVFAADGVAVTNVYPNKQLMLYSIGEHPPEVKPFMLRINDQDRALAADIKKHFRKLVFAAVVNDNEYYTALNVMFTNNEVPMTKFGYFAALPSVYIRDYADTQFKKKITEISQEYLGPIGAELLDKDCEVLDVVRSKNYDAWNITAIIDNCLVSWMGKQQLIPGPCVVIKARVKDHGSHFKHRISLTRLNYVKAFQ